MKRIQLVCVAATALLAASSAHAITNDNGVVAFTQADALSGNVTPGDAPGFPVTISVGGSYRLGSNLTVTTLVNGIEVRANEVSIDMGGFTLAGSGAGRNGITSFNRTLTVRNGTIRGFTLDGVRTIAALLALDNVVVTANARYAVRMETAGGANDVPYGSVRSSKVIANGSGIYCGAHCLVENSIVSQNQLYGILFQKRGGIALGNTVVENGRNGISFSEPGGAGNNLVSGSEFEQIFGNYIPMQPNACSPANCGPTP